VGVAATRVLQQVATTGPHDDALADAIHAHKQGNPFFVAEMLRHLEGASVQHADEFGLPESIREVIERRLGRLEQRTVDTLTAAAVIGPTFSLPVLQALPSSAEDPDALLDALDEAVVQRILVEVGSGEYSFAHVMIRQALLASLTATRRARLHRLIATTIESRARHDPGRHAAELAAHFVAASDASVVP
jgi:predicted ATPase